MIYRAGDFMRIHSRFAPASAIGKLTSSPAVLTARENRNRQAPDASCPRSTSARSSLVDKPGDIWSRIHWIWLSVVMGISRVAADDWPQWRGPKRDGSWNESGIRTRLPSDGLPVSWRVPVGRGWSGVVVAEGRAVIADAQVENGSATERILCFNESDGQLLWSHEYSVAYPDWALEPNGGGPRATPIIQDGRVTALGALGHLICLNLHDGGVVWKRELSKDYGVKEFTGISGSPLIEGHLLILQLAAHPNAGVVALDAKTGKETWKALDDQFTYSTPIAITSGGQRQLIVWMQEAITSLNPETGAVWWRETVRFPGDLAVATPVHQCDRLLVGGLMLTLAADHPSAAIAWPAAEAPLKRILSNTSTAMIRDSHLYSALISGELACLDARTGVTVWTQGGLTRPGNGSSIHLTPCGSEVFLFTDRGDLICTRLSPAGCEEISRCHLIDPTSPFGSKLCAWTPPAFANRHVFVRNDRELIRLSLAAD